MIKTNKEIKKFYTVIFLICIFILFSLFAYQKYFAKNKNPRLFGTFISETDVYITLSFTKDNTYYYRSPSSKLKKTNDTQNFEKGKFKSQDESKNHYILNSDTLVDIPMYFDYEINIIYVELDGKIHKFKKTIPTPIIPRNFTKDTKKTSDN